MFDIGSLMKAFNGNNPIASVLPLIMGAKGNKEDVMAMLGKSNPIISMILGMMDKGGAPAFGRCDCEENIGVTGGLFPPIFETGVVEENLSSEGCARACETERYPYELQRNHPDN